MSSIISNDTIALHGWTAVPRDANAILKGKPYIHKPEALLVKDMEFPSEDPLVARIQQYAKEKLPPQTYNHSMRVYYFCTFATTSID
jgi:cyanamide hydratase